LEGQSCLLSSGASDSPVCDLLPYLAHPTVGLGIGWRTGQYLMLTGQFGVPNRPLAQATCRALIARPTVGRWRRWLTGQSGEL
jgi:hypothetical protein